MRLRLFPLLVATPLLAASAPREVGLFLENHCLECHDAKVKKGGLDLESLPRDPGGDAADTWVLIHDRVRNGEMPPAKVKERPEAKEIDSLTGWIAKGVTAAETARRREAGRVPVRRLNRVEYEQSVRDLLGIDAELRDLLPEDPQLHGFDTVSDGLHLSSLHLEKYLEAADAALDAAIQLGKAPEPVKRRFTFKEDKSVRENLDTPEGKVTDPNSKNKHRVILLENAEGVVFFGEGYPPAELRELSIKAPGTYRFRVSAAAFQCPDRPVVLRFYRNRGGDKRLLSFHDIPEGAGRELELTAELKAGDKVEFAPWDVGFDAEGKSVWNVDTVGKYTGRGMLIRWVDVEGPLNSAWPPASTTALLAGVEIRPYANNKQMWIDNKPRTLEIVSTAPSDDLRRITESVASRAFRRPLAAGELDTYVKPGLDALAGKATFDAAVRACLRAVLSSPQFIMRWEKPGRLEPHALAARLSYFLWSAPPDAALLARAADGSLIRDEVLRTEALRLLADPRAANFVTSFAGQWLDLRSIEATSPDMKLYPEFDELLKESMVAETEAFLRETIAANRPAADFIDSDWLMLNRRLADHYGVPGVAGEEIRRVPRPAGSPRGGLLTMGSVLKVTANGTVSSPVLRGAWVMKRLLGEPPRPPPANVGAIEPDTRGATTIREQLAKHRTSESCASCHASMDPPGFALENFDVIGGWRDRYRSQDKGEGVKQRQRNNQYVRYKLGPPVDAGGELADGRAFTGIADFKRLLLDRREQVARAFTRNLVIYATGADVHFADRAAVERILAGAAPSQHGVRDLVTGVVLSDLFRSK